MSSLITYRSEFWWTERSHADPEVWKSSIRLGEEFFNEVIRRPIPLDFFRGYHDAVFRQPAFH